MRIHEAAHGTGKDHDFEGPQYKGRSTMSGAKDLTPMDILSAFIAENHADPGNLYEDTNPLYMDIVVTSGNGRRHDRFELLRDPLPRK